MAGINRAEIWRIADYAQQQGVDLTRTKKGILFRFGTGHTSMLHFTGSDVRQKLNLASEFHRNGIEFPDDARPLELHREITERKPRPETVARIAQAISHIDNPIKISPMELKDVVSDYYDVRRALYSLGYRPFRKPNGKLTRWWILDDPESPYFDKEFSSEEDSEEDGAPFQGDETSFRAQTTRIHIEQTTVQAEKSSRSSEIIAIDPVAIPRGTTLDALVDIYAAAGFELTLSIRKNS